MPDIGETLREARMRRRIDVAEVESATKIRAKYLRALENEEWQLLPGPTYVKSFLRTYADYLELDSRRLVEDYKLRFERPRAGDAVGFGGLQPGGGPRRPRPRPRRRRSAGAFAPFIVVAVIALGLVAALYALGKWGSGDQASTTSQTPHPPHKKARRAPSRSQHRAHAAPSRPRFVKLRLVATGDVYVCLVDAAGRRLINGLTMTAGQRSKRFKARRLRANFGTSNVRMQVGGKTYVVAPSPNPVGYELRPGRKPRRLPDAQRPSCA
jgi:cytoskeleton protein RodZ